MEPIYAQLLACLSAFARGNTQADLLPDFSDWQQLHKSAAQHKLEAVIYATLGRHPKFCGGNQEMVSQWRRRAYALSAAQAQRSTALLRATGALEQAGVSYAVVKGICCRGLYENGDLRISADEDLSVSDYPAAAEALEKAGFLQKSGDPQDVTHWFDVSSGLHIELHSRLFADPAQETVFAGFTPIRLRLPEGSVFTMPHTLHLVFLLCHARKHLITGGVGIRTLCDIAKFYEAYRDSLDLAQLDTLLEQLQCKSLLQHILAIGRDVLGIPCEACILPHCAEDLLLDVLEAGVYGQSTMTRRHSGTVTAQQAAGKKRLFRILFPEREAMEARFPDLKQRPARLPLYWLKRLGSYATQVAASPDNSPAESLQLGKKRLEMLVTYEIITKNP